jgi:peptide/nickel transport system ATP-binding protein
MRRGNRLEAISGSPPDLAALPPGCPFAPRCPLSRDDCRQSEIAPFVMKPGHSARCLHTDETAHAPGVV